MRIKRRNRKSSKLSVLCISTIVSLGMIGVGYGYWTDGLNIDVNITTGNIGGLASFEVPSSLNVDVSEDGYTIAFSGEVYPDYQEEMTITIKDTGTIPMVLEKVEEKENTDIAELSKQKKSKFGLFSTLIKDDVIETFNLSISPPEQEAETVHSMTSMSAFSMNSYVDEEEDYYQIKINELQNEIESLENEITEIQNEIDRLNVIEKHNFEYELHFIQGI